VLNRAVILSGKNGSNHNRVIISQDKKRKSIQSSYTKNVHLIPILTDHWCYDHYSNLLSNLKCNKICHIRVWPFVETRSRGNPLSEVFGNS